MSNGTARQRVISELCNLYAANGFITEDEALACFAVYKIPLSEIDSITEHLLGLGVLIRTDIDEDLEDDIDRAQTDYEAIYADILEIAPGQRMLIDYIRGVRPPQNREWRQLIAQMNSGNEYAFSRLFDMYCYRRAPTPNSRRACPRTNSRI